MPISRREFDDGKREGTLENEIVAFLKERREDAFTFNEIRHGLKGGRRSGDETFDVIHTMMVYFALEKALRKGLVISKSIDGEDYFTVPGV